MRVLISGSHGLIGSALTTRLAAEGATVVRLVRGTPSGPDQLPWAPGFPLDPAALDGVDAIINLAGASIAQIPWTARRREEILQSRLASTRTLTTALRANPGAALINASAVGWYGNRDSETLTEEAPSGAGFLADVVTRWEAAALEASDIARVALLRTGLVVANGGAVSPLRLLTRLGLGGNLGTGTQWWPWISLHDEVEAIVHVLRSDAAGAFNLAGPTPATMSELGRSLAQLMRRPYWLPAPGAALKVALGQAGEELLLSSQRVVPARLVASGFQFRDHTVTDALRALFPRA